MKQQRLTGVVGHVRCRNSVNALSRTIVVALHANHITATAVSLISTSSGIRTGSAVAPTTFGVGAQCSPGSLSMWQTVGDDYLQAEVTSIRLFLLCTTLTKLVDFFDVTGVVLVSLLLSWSRRFVTQFFSIISIDTQRAWLMANISVSGVLKQNYCCVWMCTVAVSKLCIGWVRCYVRLQSTRRQLSSDLVRNRITPPGGRHQRRLVVYT